MPDNIKSPDSFVSKLLEKTPPWVMGFCAAMLCFTLSLKVMGVDVGQPLQTVTDAYAKAIAAQADGMLKFNEATQKMEALILQQRQSLDDTNAKVTEAFTKQAATNEQVSSALQKVSDSVVALETRVNALEKDSHPPMAHKGQ